MAKLVLVDAFAYVDGYDFTGDSNVIKLAAEVEEVGSTTYGSSGWKECLPGLKSVSVDLQGLWEAGSGTVDPEAFSALGTVDSPHTIGLADVDTAAAYALRAGRFKYELGGQVGEAAPFSLMSQGTHAHGVIRGQLAKARGSVAATGVLGSVVNLGAVGASQYLYAALHVFSAGTTVTVQVQSDDSGAFSSPTTQGTFSGITAVGGTWLTRIAGALTDTHYRLNVSAITGTFSVAGFIGIGA